MNLSFTGPGGAVWTPGEAAGVAISVVVGVILTVLVYRLVRRVPWPRPFRYRFAMFHLVAAPAAGLVWLAVATGTESLFLGWPTDGRGWMVLVGSFVYVVVAGVSYAGAATARAARAEAAEAQAQLAALRGQLHPHFLFNALHAVVQLIPVDPERAADAAERVASLLRTTIEEERDEVPLRDEWAFVSRYLEVERMRFGDRLCVHAEVDPALLDTFLPAFSLHTLVENAVRHGAALRVEPTHLAITTSGTPSGLTLTVRNTGARRPTGRLGGGAGTGLSRLRERLAVLYGDAGRLACGEREDGGYEAVLAIPRRHRGRA